MQKIQEVKTKANAAQGLPEMLKIAVGRHFRENNNEKHYRNAALGWYRYDSRFALPVYGENGKLERYNVFHANPVPEKLLLPKRSFDDAYTIKRDADPLRYASLFFYQYCFTVSLDSLSDKRNISATA